MGTGTLADNLEAHARLQSLLLKAYARRHQ
jgi:hypothetical protein